MIRLDGQGWLEAQGVRLNSWAVGDHRATCPWCSPGRKKKRDECLAITVKGDGGIIYFCHHCEARGLAGVDDDKLSDRQWKRRPPPPKREKPVYRDPPPRRVTRPGDAMLAYFRRRGISKETLHHYRVGECVRWMPPPISAEVTAIAFPYYDRGKLVNRKYRALTEKSFIQDKQTRRTLFDIDRIRDADEIIVVEGELDVLACAEAGFAAVTTLPDGAGKSERTNSRRVGVMKESGLVESDCRIVLAGDHDRPGMAMRATLAELFGPARCRAVEWPTGGGVICKDAGDCLMAHGVAAVRECVELAQSCTDGRV